MGEVSTRDLERALRRLKAGQGRIARRNARRAVTGALRSLLTAIYRDFPLLPKAPAKPAEPKPRKYTPRTCKVLGGLGESRCVLLAGHTGSHTFRSRPELNRQRKSFERRDLVALPAAEIDLRTSCATHGVRARKDLAGVVWVPRWVLSAERTPGGWAMAATPRGRKSLATAATLSGAKP